MLITASSMIPASQPEILRASLRDEAFKKQLSENVSNLLQDIAGELFDIGEVFMYFVYIHFKFSCISIFYFKSLTFQVYKYGLNTKMLPKYYLMFFITQ